MIRVKLMNRFHHASLLLCLGLWTLQSIPVHAQVPAKLLRWIPADANAVTSIDVDALFRAPLAMREGWRKRAGDRFVNQEINVPPEAKRVVMVSQIDLGGTLNPAWEFGLIELEKTPSFALMARRDGGQLDTIAGH